MNAERGTMILRSIKLLALLLLLVGCTSSPSQCGTAFVVRDAATGRPIEGVKVSAEKYNVGALLPYYETVEVAYTDEQGRAMLESLPLNTKDHVEFRHAGYEKETASGDGDHVDGELVVELKPRRSRGPFTK